MIFRLAAAGLFAACAFPTLAAPRTVALNGSGTRVDFRAWGMGLVPIDGTFTRFQGTLTYDPDDRTSCRVNLAVEVPSLVMRDPDRLAEILSPVFLDAAAYPRMHYEGACRDGGAIDGALSMHGVDHPLSLALSWQTDALKAVGDVVRAEWGITAKPMMVGRTVRILVNARLPP